jgi:hypothetical protein
MMEPQVSLARKSFDQRVINEQLSSRANGDWLGGQGHCADQQQGGDQGASHE